MSKLLLNLILNQNRLRLIKPLSQTGSYLRLLNVQTSNPTQNTPSNNRILTIPNLLTISRIASIPFINYFIFADQHELACGLFVAAALTDFLDGSKYKSLKFILYLISSQLLFFKALSLDVIQINLPNLEAFSTHQPTNF